MFIFAQNRARQYLLSHRETASRGCANRNCIPLPPVYSPVTANAYRLGASVPVASVRHDPADMTVVAVRMRFMRTAYFVL
jgi:hypothetical protein